MVYKICIENNTNIMETQKILQNIGLSPKESLAYVALAELGPASITDIAKHAKMHRPDAYKAIEGLLARGLVTKVVKGKRTHFAAEPPEKLNALLGELQNQFTELIPQLKSIYHAEEQKPVVKFLEGKRGITSIFEDLTTSLKRGDIFYRYSSAKDTAKANSYLPKNYREVRDQKQLERYVITSASTAEAKRPRLERDMKVVPEEFGLFDFDVTQVIYGDKIAFIDYNSDTAIVIENKIIAEFQKRIFKMLFAKL